MSLSFKNRKKYANVWSLENVDGLLEYIKDSKEFQEIKEYPGRYREKHSPWLVVNLIGTATASIKEYDPNNLDNPRYVNAKECKITLSALEFFFKPLSKRKFPSNSFWDKPFPTKIVETSALTFITSSIGLLVLRFGNYFLDQLPFLRKP